MSYNGWTNYETWRVHLEMFDGWSGSPLTADSAQEIAEEHLQSQCSEGLVLDYALSFLRNVNWQEIAEACNETAEDEDEGDEDEF